MLFDLSDIINIVYWMIIGVERYVMHKNLDKGELEMCINAKQVSDILKNLCVETPKTCSFDKEDGQKDKRWWDNIGETKENMSKQQYHVVAHFICLYYHGKGFPSKCERKCNECYLKEEYKTNEPINEKPQNIYDTMGRPEMYMWIIEALQILNDVSLKECFDRINNKWKEPHNYNTRIKEVRNIISEYVTWKDIELKISSIKDT